MRIESFKPLQQSLTQSTAIKDSAGKDDFGQLLMDAIKEVNRSQLDAAKMQQDLMAGRKVEYHDVIFAMERASLSMQLTIQVRNKLLEAYQEIQRLQI